MKNQKRYEQLIEGILTGGTKVKVIIYLEIEDYSASDSQQILSQIGVAARKLYLKVAQEFNSKL